MKHIGIVSLMNKWDVRFMRLAEEVATWSKHPHTKVGCVIVDDAHNQLSGGYNGLPRGINDDRLQDQSQEVSGTVHAEANAVAAAARHGGAPLLGTTVYVSQPICAQCAALLIQAGIKRVVFQSNPNMMPKWTASCEEGSRLLTEAKVELVQMEWWNR